MYDPQKVKLALDVKQQIKELEKKLEKMEADRDANWPNVVNKNTDFFADKFQQIAITKNELAEARKLARELKSQGIEIPEEEPELQDIEILVENPKPPVSNRTAASTKKHNDTKPQKTVNSQGSHNSKTDEIKRVDVSVMKAIRRVIPDSLSRADVLAAFVYLHTGDCELTPKAEQVVNNYDGDQPLKDIGERLAYLEKSMRHAIDLLYAVELNAAVNMADRLYASVNNRGKDVKKLDMLQTGVLDVIDSVRAQAKEYAKQEKRRKGSYMYHLFEDLDDD